NSSTSEVKAASTSEVSLGGGHIAAVQGYQWHVLNKSQTWVTRGVRTEYAGSYVIERSGCEIYGGLKQIAGSVYGIRADVLRKFGWGTSITEDFELTLRLYEAGYKVAFTPYIQTPAEAVSTIKRLIRQRMRWAEGASFNVKIMLPRILFGRWVEAEQLMVDDGSLKVDNPASTFQHQNPPSSFHPLSSKVWVPSKLTLAEKLEFIYLAPYYLQAAFFVVGTICWFLSEAVFGARLPFWTAAFGWSLVFTNLLALPLMNIIGLFLEESDERDYVGILSFVALSYIVVPFQAYAAIKGFLEREEGPWFRTPKTGLVTDVIKRGRFHRLIAGILGKPEPAAAQFLIPNYSNYSNQIPNPNDQDNLGQLGIRSIRSISHPYLSLATAHNRFQNFQIRPRHIRWVGNLALGVIISITVLLSLFAPLMTATTSYAADPILRTVSDSQKEVDRAKIDQGTEDGGEKGEEITTPRAISKTTKGGKKLEFIFHEEARVRVKLEHREIEFETEKVFGQRVNPKRSRIKADKEVVYEEIIPGIDLKYSITNDLLVEEVILKTPDAAAHLGGVPQAQHHLRGGNASEVSIIQTLRTVDVKVVSPDPGAFGFFADDGKELFRFGAPFAKDAGGAVSNDLSFTLDKPFDFAQGYRLTKTLGESAKTWLTDPQRAYPVSIDPSVIVSGGIVETETQFGGLQRKIVYMSGANGGAAWYAFYNDGADVFYKRCLESSACDEAADWSAAQDLDTGDADNYNPTIAVSGNFIVVFWIDLSANAYEGRRFDVSTAFAHTLGTLCTSASLGTLSSTFMVSVALLDNDTGYVAYSDTSSDTEFGVELFFTLSGICTTASANFAGLTITNDSRLTAGDRPVLVPINSTGVDMIFQDGDLSYSRLHDVNWSRQNITIASVTDNIYSVTTDGTTVWILTVSGTTATNMYKCCTADIVETQVDSDAGATGHDSISDIDMFCVAADDCKIVYTDDIDTTPTLIFVDCNDEDCSTKTVTTLDADIGDSLDQAGASVFCVTDGTSVSGNCKIAYGDDMDTTPLLKVIDCTNDTDCSTNTSGTVDTNLGNAASVLHTSIDCPADDDCKITYNDTGLSDFFFVDCSTIACSTGNTVTQIDSASGTAPRSDLDCSAGADNCKFVYNDANATGGCADADSICFVDCSAAECGTGRTLTVVDVDAGVTNNASPVSIDCVGGDTDCKLVYGDGTDEAMYFVDCGDATCTVANATIQSIDNTVAGANTSRSFGAAMDCTPGVADCKIVYPDDTGNSVISFADCDDATCSPIGSTEVIPGARFNGTIQCLTTANCKLAYYDGTAETDPTVQFLDCDVADCLPSATSLTAPWTGQTNVTSVSLSLDTTNNALYANILKDTSEQAYFKSTDKSTISWSAETSYAFTAGDLGHISTPEKGAGTTQIGAVLRQGANFEFAVVPERIWFLMGVLPFLPRLFKKMKSRRRNL
ncbi:glycosyltransferase family 2 protein, partial [Candidatus Curtissbacteria bacterium]|nr:glycosyltransferase family 2 protein [Candidatus Curtissbacteria bacterium]